MAKTFQFIVSEGGIGLLLNDVEVTHIGAKDTAQWVEMIAIQALGLEFQSPEPL